MIKSIPNKLRHKTRGNFLRRLALSQNRRAPGRRTSPKPARGLTLALPNHLRRHKSTANCQITPDARAELDQRRFRRRPPPRNSSSAAIRIRLPPRRSPTPPRRNCPKSCPGEEQFDHRRLLVVSDEEIGLSGGFQSMTPPPERQSASNPSSQGPEWPHRRQPQDLENWSHGKGIHSDG